MTTLSRGEKMYESDGYCSKVEIMTFLKVHFGDQSTLVKLLNKQQKFKRNENEPKIESYFNGFSLRRAIFFPLSLLILSYCILKNMASCLQNEYSTSRHDIFFILHKSRGSISKLFSFYRNEFFFSSLTCQEMKCMNLITEKVCHFFLILSISQ